MVGCELGKLKHPLTSPVGSPPCNRSKQMALQSSVGRIEKGERGNAAGFLRGKKEEILGKGKREAPLKSLQFPHHASPVTGMPSHNWVAEKP